MKKHNRTKLALNSQTIRALSLTPSELRVVAGGRIDLSAHTGCDCDTDHSCIPSR